MQLQGLYRVEVAADWRFVMPKPWRCAFNTATRPTAMLTRRDPDCLRIYDPGRYGHAVQACVALPARQQADLFMFGAAREAELDWHGHLAIEGDLRDWLRVDAPFSAVLIGMLGYLELWPETKWFAWIEPELPLVYETLKRF